MAGLAPVAGAGPLAAGAAPVRAPATLTLGITDSGTLASPDLTTDARWMSTVATEGASVVRLNLDWRRVAPERPADAAQATSPTWAGYRWPEALDGAVRDSSTEGMQVLFTIYDAPAWAEGARRPALAPPGTWRPQPQALAAFARAAALRYSGSCTPSGSSAPLPRVRYWQAWNEPNLSIYLAPQWRRAARGWAPASPGLYRSMLDAFYNAVHGVRADNQVLSAGTAPYGDPPGGARMPPAQFLRNLLCLTESGLRPARCPEHARFDILDHHPYSAEGPFFRAFNRDDVAVADMAKLIDPLRRAESLGLVGGPHRHPVWVTELSWDSSPPNSGGVPVGTQARWLEQALALLWRQGVSTVLWYGIADDPPGPAESATFEAGGLYYRDGRPKPAATAYRFPFVLSRASPSTVLIWVRAPASGRLVIERLTGHGWRESIGQPVRAGQILVRHVASATPATMRARVGRALSLPFTQR